jgi:hypothetical protein
MRSREWQAVVTSIQVPALASFIPSTQEIKYTFPIPQPLRAIQEAAHLSMDVPENRESGIVTAVMGNLNA